MAEGSRSISRPAGPHLQGWVLLFVLERLDSPQLAVCSTICRDWQNIISGDPDLWKRAYIKEKHSSIATEIWPHFTSDVEVPSTPQTTEKCNVSENIRQAASWKRAAVAAFTWRRFHSGPITSIAVKACSDRLVACRVKGNTTAILSSGGAVRLWDLRSMTCIFSVETRSTFLDGDIEFDSAMVVASCGQKHIKVFSRHSQQVTRSIEVNRSPSSKSIRLHDASLYVACLDGTVKVFDLYSGSCSQIIRLCDSFYRVTCIHVDAEKSLLLAGLSNGHVALYNLERCTQITECYRRILPTCVQIVGEHFIIAFGCTYLLHGLLNHFPKANYRQASPSRFKSALHLTENGGALVVFLSEPGVRCVSRFVRDGSDLNTIEYIDPSLEASSRDSNATLWTRTPSWASLGRHGDVNEEEEEVTCADGSGPIGVTTHGNGTFKVWKWGFPS